MLYFLVTSFRFIGNYFPTIYGMIYDLGPASQPLTHAPEVEQFKAHVLAISTMIISVRLPGLINCIKFELLNRTICITTLKISVHVNLFKGEYM